MIAMASGFSLSAPIGKYTTGTTVIELTDYGRLDPFAPSPSLRELMVSVFYPAQPSASQTSHAPYLPPKTAALFADGFGVSKESLQSLIMTSMKGASYDRAETFPIIFFSPGYRVPRLLFSALAENLASYGYLVITVDHPYDSILVEYPDGRIKMPQASNGSHIPPPRVDTTDCMNQAIDVRVQDLSFVLDQLRTNNSIFAKHIPNFPSVVKITQTKVGVFGHSLGGASSATVILRDSRFLCGASLDGKMSGPVIEKGLDQPFILVGAEGNTKANVSGWSEFWTHLRSFRRLILIKGTTHGSFEDLLLLGEVYATMSPNGTVPPNLFHDLGTIRGSRMIEIITVYINALFDKCFKKGSGALFDGPNLQYFEVLFEN